MASGSDLVILVDGTYEVSSSGSAEMASWTIPAGTTLMAEHQWAATIVFGPRTQLGMVAESGAQVIGIELIAPSSWSVLDLYPGSVGDGLLIHDTNQDSEFLYGGAEPWCVQQGVVDVSSGASLINSVMYDTGDRDGAASCATFHPVYFTNNNRIENNLIIRNRGGWCLHAFRPDDLDNLLANNTLIDCGRQGIILWGGSTNTVTGNILQLNAGCINVYDGGPPVALDNACDDGSGPGVIELGDLGLDVASSDDLIRLFDAAATPQQKVEVAQSLSADRSKSSIGYSFEPIANS